MSFLAVKVSQSSLWISHKPIALGLLHSAPAATSRLSYCHVAPLLPRCIRCRAQEEGETSVQGESRPKEINPSLSSSSSSETYGGWSSDEPDFEGNWKSGLLKLGAGLVLALGFSLLTYSMFSKFGRKQAAIPQIPVQEQETLLISLSESSEVASNNMEATDEPVLGEDSKLEFPTQRKELELEAEKLEKKSTPATQSIHGKVVVPAVVDQMQEHALEALQALKVVDPDVEAGEICTRREYARWLIAASSKLTRSSVHKVFPAMYIENITDLAFDDVPVEDPDFPFIQGLAEAGLVSSNLSLGQHDNYGANFSPDSPLSRQDLVSWKLALECRQLPLITKEALQEVSGFADVDRIHEDAWPALMADLTSKGPSIIASAFGFTRRFQPEKPTTVGQAAIALASGEAAELLSEDLARLEAESMAEEAVRADITMEVQAQKEFNQHHQEELLSEKAKREQVEAQIDGVRAQLENLISEREEEKSSILKDQATIDTEKRLLHALRNEVDAQLQALSTLQVEVATEKERLENLRTFREEELELIANFKAELEVERNALSLVRSWAEDEAKQARAEGKLLEEVRKRWEEENGRIEVYKSGKEWGLRYVKMKLKDIMQWLDTALPGEAFKTHVNDKIVRSWQATSGLLPGLLQKMAYLLQELGRKAHYFQQDLISGASQTAQELQIALGRRSQDVKIAVDQGTEEAKAAVAGMSSAVVERSQRFAENCKEEAAKLVHRFKSE
ncbi:unnamed protein product [Sphagnum balticum]